MTLPGLAGPLFRALAPKPRLTVSQWADEHRRIPAGTSPEAGRWRTDRVPYLREIMDALNDPGIEIVVLMLASQLGKTEALLNVLGYHVAHDPAPLLLVQPTIEAMKAFSKERVDPTFRATPSLRGKLDYGMLGRSSARKTSNTIQVKHFPGGYLAMAGANAPAGLASRAIRVVLCDEIDRFPPSAGTEGDPVRLAIQRTSNFWNRKIVLVSTPTVRGASPIERWHAQGDQRQYQVPCPHCGTLQVLLWERMVLLDSEGRPDPDAAHYLCAECDGRIEEHHRPQMLADGEWIAQAPGGRIASFGDLSALYSPWVRWATLAAEYLKARRDPDRRGLQEFTNLRLGQPWEEHRRTVAVEALERLREDYSEPLPEGALVITAGVDVQDDRLEVELVAWGVGKESYGVCFRALPGDPADPSVWQDLDSLLARTWRTRDGRALGVRTTAVDSGGHRTSEVYHYCRAREGRRVWAVKGRGGAGVPMVAKPTRTGRDKVALFSLGVDEIKDLVMARLQVDAPGPGRCHFPADLAQGYDGTYFRGLLSEQRVEVRRRDGSRVWEWRQIFKRNEPLDCRVYATAALEILNPDLTGPERGGSVRPPAPARRRVLSRGLS